MPKFYLLLSGIGLSIIALSYGLSPGTILPAFLEITVTGTDQTHIFRAVMCLYFGMSGFWITAAFRPLWTRPAVASVVFFMSGLGLGRLLSIVSDGVPSSLLLIYLGLEVAMAGCGLYLLTSKRSF